jgi:hypothetical protein
MSSVSQKELVSVFDFATFYFVALGIFVQRWLYP